jgi:ribose transport system substrate-binding protein
VDDTNAFSVEESIRDIFMEQDVPDIMICLNELTTTCVYQAVVDYNKVGDVSILGFYDSDTIVKAIDRNVIYATIAIDTQQMGSFCIDALTEYYELGYTSQYFTADIRLINKDNVSEYLEKGEDSDEIP